MPFLAVGRTEVGANCAGVAGDGTREDTAPEAGLGLANAVEDMIARVEEN